MSRSRLGDRLEAFWGCSTHWHVLMSHRVVQKIHFKKRKRKAGLHCNRPAVDRCLAVSTSLLYKIVNFTISGGKVRILALGRGGWQMSSEAVRQRSHLKQPICYQGWLRRMRSGHDENGSPRRFPAAVATTAGAFPRLSVF